MPKLKTIKKSDLEALNWYIGPPPRIGWWNVQSLLFGSTVFKTSNKWSWWDGEHWSWLVKETATPEKLLHQVSRTMRKSIPILWSHYWPENARVKREVPWTYLP